MTADPLRRAADLLALSQHRPRRWNRYTAPLRQMVGDECCWLPGPDVLGKAIGPAALPNHVNHDGHVAERGSGRTLDAGEVTAAILATIPRLPEVPDADDPNLGGLRTVAAVGGLPDWYLIRAAKAARFALPRELPTPPERMPRPAPKTSTERSRAHREAVHQMEQDTARWLLAALTELPEGARDDFDLPALPERFTFSDAHAAVTAAATALLASYDADEMGSFWWDVSVPAPADLRTPRERVLSAVLRDLWPLRTVRGVRYYVRPVDAADAA